MDLNHQSNYLDSLSLVANVHHTLRLENSSKHKLDITSIH